MKINYNVTGARRRELAAVIGNALKIRPMYMGMPTAAYQIGSFTLSRDGVLDYLASTYIDDVRTVLDAVTAAGFEPASERDAEAEPGEAPAASEGNDTTEEAGPEQAAGEIPEAGREETDDILSEEPDQPETATALSDTPSDPEKADNGFPGDISPDGVAVDGNPDDDHKPETDDVPRPETEDVPDSGDKDDAPADLSISLPDNLSDEAFGNLEKVIAAKQTLMRHAFQSEGITVERKDGQITFSGFTASDGEHTDAYTRYAVLLTKFAREAKRVTGKDYPVDNEKFAFRCFILRIGMIGPEFKQARKILLENLTGNSSWKNGAPAKAAAPAGEPAEKDTDETEVAADE